MSRYLLAPLVGLTLLAGCVVNNGPGSNGEPVFTLGAQAAPGYHLLANASTVIPAGDIGFAVTANGNGGYRVVFTDTLNSASVFSGFITTDGTFDQTVAMGADTNVTQGSANRIDFSGVPGAGVDGVDTVSSTDPIYVTALIDGSTGGVGIFFTGASTGLVQNAAFDPVAFTSP